eukprot:TRINITY_DN27114_c0_g1_i1.p1 TRINITY_DN27114_c0_g1~~TRINITY_DN27114_c0_g1_i1.p1  ORF type:complete len:331 (-),score=64.04 TRINITY_DN27114_c0_g1_i1:90-1082(-)
MQRLLHVFVSALVSLSACGPQLAVAAREPLQFAAAEMPQAGKTHLLSAKAADVPQAGKAQHPDCQPGACDDSRHKHGWFDLEVLREIVTGHAQVGRKPLPFWLKRKVVGLIFLLLSLTTATVALIAFGVHSMGRGKAAGEAALPGKMGAASLNTSMKGVAESRQEVLRGIIDAALLHSKAGPQGSDKLLSQIFNEITERTWSLSKTNLLDDGVESVLESALTIHQELVDGDVASERHQLLLDLIGGVLNTIPEVASKMRILDTFMEATHQQICALVQEKVMSERMLADLDAAKETDGLLRQRFHDLRISSKATKCAHGMRGCFSGLTVLN